MNKMPKVVNAITRRKTDTGPKKQTPLAKHKANRKPKILKGR